jgi:hypothetical protein
VHGLCIAVFREGPLTHMPPQFRMPSVLIEEWRARAAASRPLNEAAAEVYERCANELLTLDIHTEGAPAGASRRSRRAGQMPLIPVVAAFVATAVVVAGFTASRAPRTRTGSVGEN